MNKWVVLILMALAFAAGGLSFYQMGQRTAATAPASQTPLAAASPAASASATPVAESTATPGRVQLASGTLKGPNFGRPPGAGGSPSGSGGASPAPSTKPALVTGEIRAHVFTTEPGGPARTEFAPTTKNIYLTLSPVGMRDSVELVASIRSVMNEGEPFSQPVQSSGPPRLRTFRFAPPANGWQSGPYQVLIKPAGSEQTLLMSRFEIQKSGTPAEQPYAKPDYLRLIEDTSQPDKTSSVFSSDDPQVHLVVDSSKVPEGVKVRTVWSVVEVDKLTPGELFAVSELSPPGPEQDPLFTFAPPKGGFLPGSYRVDVYFGQQQVGSQAFFVQPADQAAATEEAAAGASPTSAP
jgi:hypothetical protein